MSRLVLTLEPGDRIRIGGNCWISLPTWARTGVPIIFDASPEVRIVRRRAIERARRRARLARRLAAAGEA